MEITRKSRAPRLGRWIGCGLIFFGAILAFADEETGAAARVEFYEERIKELQATIAIAYRPEELEKIQAKVTGEVDEFNSWLRKRESELQLLANKGRSRKQFDREYAEFNAEVAKRRRALTVKQNEVARLFEEYNQFHANHTDKDLVQDLHDLILRVSQDEVIPAESREELLDEIQPLREELGEFYMELQEGTSLGMVVVEVIFKGGIKGYYILDTGASYTTITPALAEMLGVADNAAQDVLLQLAGGYQITGPLVIIPEIRVAGNTVTDVPAVIVDNSTLGVDGLLGQSFLRNFELVVNKNEDPPVKLYRLEGSTALTD